MQINRRTFIVGSSSFAALATTGSIASLGCNQNQKDTISALIQVLGNASAQVAALQGVDPNIIQQIKGATATAIATVQGWKAGTTAAEQAIQALTALVNILYLIPAVEPYVQLINLAIVTAEALLALIPAGATVQPKIIRKRSVPAATRPAPKTKQEFKSQWNDIVASNPSLAKAAI